MENLLRVVELLFIFVVGPVLLLACWLFIFYSNQWWPLRPKPVIEPEPESDLHAYETVYNEFKRYYNFSDEEVTMIEDDKTTRQILCICFRFATSEVYDSHEAHDYFYMLKRCLWRVNPLFECMSWLGWLDFGTAARAKLAAERGTENFDIPHSEESFECKPEATAGATPDIGTSNLPIEP